MNRFLVGIVAFGAGLAVAAPSAWGAVTCEQIHAAMKAGKTEAQVAKELKVPVKRVKSCMKAPQHKAPPHTK